MIAFASNSLLCRLALKHTAIDAASFTFVRIFSGAVALWLIVKMRNASAVAAVPDRRTDGVDTRRVPRQGLFPRSPLYIYAAAFSFAYNTLSAGTGALLLFGAVQATMILWGLRKGESLHARQLIGLAVAVTGLLSPLS